METGRCGTCGEPVGRIGGLVRRYCAPENGDGQSLCQKVAHGLNRTGKLLERLAKADKRVVGSECGEMGESLVWLSLANQIRRARDGEGTLDYLRRIPAGQTGAGRFCSSNGEASDA